MTPTLHPQNLRNICAPFLRSLALVSKAPTIRKKKKNNYPTYSKYESVNDENTFFSKVIKNFAN